MIATIKVPEDCRATEHGDILYAGTYRVQMPDDYDPASVTGEDILCDNSIRIVDQDAIRAALTDVRTEARAQGWDGIDDDYEYTDVDMEAVVDTLGYRPTREEWAEAGLAWVGERHLR